MTISHCDFVNCGSGQSTYSILLDVYNYDFLKNKVTFTNIQNSCGCISCIRVSKHVYKNNVFHNAKRSGNYNSVGLDENSDSYSNKIITIIINTFDTILGTCQGSCIYINFKGYNFLVQNCQEGWFFMKMELLC